MPDVSVYTRIPEELDVALEVECAHRRIKKPKAIAEALAAWIASAPASSGLAGALAAESRRQESAGSADFGKLTKAEFAYLSAALQIIREKPRYAHTTITETLNVWLEDHPPEAQPSVEPAKKDRQHRRAG